jgi:hypothetical protein
MNVLSALLVLFLCVSCGGDSKKEKCTLNGQQVNCKDMPGKNPQIESLKGTVLKAKVTAAITQDVANKKFEVIENSFDSSTAEAQNLRMTCGVQTYSGQIVSYNIYDNFADLSINNDRHHMKRLVGNKNSIMGLWTSTIVKSGIEQVMQLTVLESSIRIEVTCTVL